MQSVIQVLIPLSQLIGLIFCSNIMAAEGDRPNIVLVMVHN
ncbi:hypothetical protein [Rubinisphaera sp.]|nr:hypothetical protein [Rubinisphaera sp.]